MHKKVLFGCASAAALICSTPTLAQTASPAQTDAAPTPDGAASTPPVEDIVVTARRVSERLQDIPLAVTAFNSEMLKRQSIREVRDLSSTVPNLKIASSNNGGSGVVVTIRGQSQSNSGLLFIDPAVGVYVDSLNVPRNEGLRSGLVDISRVEVLRGPQGTLYGRNTTGGAVSIITNDPTDDLGGSIQGSYGNYNAFNILGIINAPLAEGLNMRIVAQHGEHGPYGHQVLTGKGLDDEDNTYARAKLKYESGDLRVTLGGDYFRYRSAGSVFHLTGITPASADTRFSGRVANVPGAVPVTPTNPTGTGTYLVAGGTSTAAVQRYLGLPFTPAGLSAAAAVLQSYVYSGAIGFHDTYGTGSENYGFPADTTAANGKGGSLSLDVGLDLNDIMSLRSISGYRTYKRAVGYDIDSTPFPLFATLDFNPHNNFYSEEFQFLGKTADLKWVLGGFFSHEQGIEEQPNVALQALGATNYALGNNDTTNISKAVYGQASYDITRALTLTVGARYTWDTRRLLNRNRTIGPVTTSGVRTETCLIPPSLQNSGTCGYKQEVSFSDPSWLASLDYKITQDVLAYAKYSRGYRAGGIQGRANLVSNPLAFTPFRPETLSEFEGGVKSQLFDRHLTLNLAAYYDKYSNVQRTITAVNPATGAGYTLVSNAATARLYGFEAEANLRVGDHLRLNGNLGYLHAKYLSFSDASLGDRSGENWPAPKLTYSIGATYNAPIGVGELSASVSWDHKSKEDLQPQAIIVADNTQKGYGLLNGRIGVSFEKSGLDVAVFGRNLLDKEYYQAGVNLETVGLAELTVGDPRTYGIQITKKFGAF